jgi:hypothetical protein
MISMTKKIKRIIVTRTIVYDRDCHLQPFDNDQQFKDWVEEMTNDDFKYQSNFTEQVTFHHG